MFRFTIRDLLWLMVVVAVSLGWWNERRKFEAYYQLVISNIKWTPAGPGPGYVHTDAEIMEVLADENAALKEEIEFQRKLIETLKAERQEIRDKLDPS